ncbi:bifunctional methylenetetrahydrofolate dehydrogenase/methenyltetrahydrofolate cyclohydrolase FolD [Simkania negevensis]|uniref:Bifunctional protein FolD n=1 Tax=Simkania negevensis (strain ATCC VR-1471 / DSM 27360 / Z) TaxID=331113 RepID=F8L7R8_SIMNZ|nr:bifunctional methylenetetrahydrofolate dehydrogenase/methenyltetrahydrofolate cyclohydrolase FolD [Simkania negevensis]CCB88811.1 bifunctional protein folD [Simkania negevensis Z]
MNLIDGKRIAQEIREELKQEINLLKGRKPGLAFILVGEDPASEAYVRMKKKGCLETGIYSEVLELPASVSEEALLKHISVLNEDEKIDGILVQQPLPSHISESKVIQAVKPEKDVDGFHPMNIGKLLLGEEGGFAACTPLGVMQLLERSAIDPGGKHVVIVGRSNIVGKPLAALLVQKKPYANATVTIAHSRTENLTEVCRSADILVAAIGKAHFIESKMVKVGSVVIDVGINRVDKKIVGDVNFEAVKEQCSAITPVPGGVGPMTIAMLLSNTLLSYKLRCI